ADAGVPATSASLALATAVSTSYYYSRSDPAKPGQALTPSEIATLLLPGNTAGESIVSETLGGRWYGLPNPDGDIHVGVIEHAIADHVIAAAHQHLQTNPDSTLSPDDVKRFTRDAVAAVANPQSSQPATQGTQLPADDLTLVTSVLQGTGAYQMNGDEATDFVEMFTLARKYIALRLPLTTVVSSRVDK